MNEMINLGLSKDIINMLYIYDNPEYLSDDVIVEKENILKRINCSENQIKEIILNYPEYLIMDNNDIIKLINYFKEIGIHDINNLLETNPFILRLDLYEIKNYIDKKISSGKHLSDIIDEIELKPYIFNEI